VGEFVTVTTDEQGVATVRIDRAPVNALSPQVFEELAEAARQCADDTRIGAVVVWGGPKVFAAGADIKQMQDTTFQEYYAAAGGLQESLGVLQRVPKVVIAAINGYALGGGLEVALACDFRYAAEDARLGQPEIMLGLIPGAGGTQRLPRLIGPARAKELVYGGAPVKAARALEIGLVERVHPAGEVYDRAVEDARRYAAGPFALRFAKQAIDQGLDMDLASGLRLESTLFAATFATEDRRIGVDSFIENGPGKATFTRN
jgi:enoyl-CoA hydratase/carnithine racemase